METRGHADACESGAIIAPSRRDGAGMIRGRKNDTGNGGGTDAAFAAASGLPATLESFGLVGYGFHSSEDEYIDLDSIEPRLYLLTRLVMDDARER